MHMWFMLCKICIIIFQKISISLFFSLAMLHCSWQTATSTQNHNKILRHALSQSVNNSNNASRPSILIHQESWREFRTPQRGLVPYVTLPRFLKAGNRRGPHFIFIQPHNDETLCTLLRNAAVNALLGTAIQHFVIALVDDIQLQVGR